MKLSEADQVAYEDAEAEARELKRKSTGDPHANPDEKEILKCLLDRIDLDVAKERRRKAKRIINIKCSPDPDKIVAQQLCLPGFEPKDHDRDLRVRNGTGQIEKLGACRPDFLRADAQRARRNANSANESANFKSSRSDEFSAWVIDNLAKGRKPEELTVDTWVLEMDLLKPKPPGEKPKPEPSPDDDDD